jgi:hypothetical protein
MVAIHHQVVTEDQVVVAQGQLVQMEVHNQEAQVEMVQQIQLQVQV